MSDIGDRKEDHLELCAAQGNEVGYEHTRTLLDDVALVHEPLPELALDDIDLRCTVLGKELAAPLLISAMTGGTERAGKINRELAAVAEELGIGFALGSQRPMLDDSSLSSTYEVRQQAPSTLIIGNLGLWQARDSGPDAVLELCRKIGADAIAVHLNPAQELVQPGGDRDFRGGLAALEVLRRELTVPVVVKETGCGIGPTALGQLAEIGIEHVDVAGAGGTSWVAVEARRTRLAEGQGLGHLLREWGVPTAVSLALAAERDFTTLIASGGIGTGLDAARALALGATAVGIARPVLQAYWANGAAGARQFLADVIAGLRATLLLTGTARAAELRRAPRVLGRELGAWLEQLS